MDTDDLELDEDFLLPHQVPPQLRAAQEPIADPYFQLAVQHASTRTPANTTIDAHQSIPGPAGRSAREVVHVHARTAVRGGNNAVLGSVGPNLAAIGSCVVCLEECLPFLAGGGYSVKLQVRLQSAAFFTCLGHLEMQRSLGRPLS